MEIITTIISFICLIFLVFIYVQLAKAKATSIVPEIEALT